MKSPKIYAQNHQERFGIEKRTKKAGEGYAEDIFSEIAPFEILSRSEDHQLMLYEKGDYALIQEFFKHGGCFRQRVQRQMIKDDNIKMLSAFLDYWEFIPTERSYMLKRGSIDFIRQYLVKKNIGKQGVEMVKSKRFSDEFIKTYLQFLNGKAQKVCKNMRNLTLPRK